MPQEFIPNYKRAGLKTIKDAFFKVSEMIIANSSCAGLDGTTVVMFGGNYYQLTPKKKEKK